MHYNEQPSLPAAFKPMVKYKSGGQGTDRTGGREVLRQAGGRFPLLPDINRVQNLLTADVLIGKLHSSFHEQSGLQILRLSQKGQSQ